MTLVKTSVLSFIATVIKLLAGLVINKAVSIFIGPSGLAVIGQFQNSIGIIQTVGKAGINSGVTKYTAEYHENENLRINLWSTSLKLTLFSSVLMSIVLIFYSNYISIRVFNSTEYSYVFTVFGFTLTLFTINQLLLSILNGLKEIKKYITINIIQSIYSLFFTTVLIIYYQLDGALVAMVTNQSVVFIIVLYKLRGHNKIVLKNFIKRIDKNISKKLLKYSLMSLISALTVPLSLMVIRNYIGDNLSWEQAGYWQAMTYISSMYLMVITTALSTYYLPRLSEIKGKDELRRELKKGYIIIIPIVVMLALIVFFLKDVLLFILFTPDFKPMLELFKWQLFGDVIKIASWLLAYLMLARAMTKLFIFSEMIFSITSIILSMYFVEHYELVGITYAYVLNYTLYLLFMIVVMRKQLF